MKHTLELQENLRLKQAEITEIGVRDGAVCHVKTETGAIYETKAAIICTGTFLRGKIIVGEVSRESGPDGMFASVALADCLRKLGLELTRFKTGTPPRINARSVDYSKMEEQPGDPDPIPFSYETLETPVNKVSCYLT